MSTKQVLRDQHGDIDFSDWLPCTMCNRLSKPSNYNWRFRPRWVAALQERYDVRVCPLCVGRGASVVGRFFVMREFLDNVANVACLADGKEDCACIPCSAGKLYDQLFPEAEEAEEAGEAVDVHGSVDGADLGGRVGDNPRHTDEGGVPPSVRSVDNVPLTQL